MQKLRCREVKDLPKITYLLKGKLWRSTFKLKYLTGLLCS